jgi:CIC family chloride channel protein
MAMQLERLTTRFGELVEDLRKQEDRLALVLSLVIGALVGAIVVAFILLTGRLSAHMYPAGGQGWRRILVPTLGSLLTGYLLFRYFPSARGSGIPQTRAAIFIHDGRISLKTVIGKFLCCSTSLASGIALGREGPSVQIGAGVASVIGQRLGLSREQIRWLVPVGASAALAAAFNTPIAAVLFSLEEIMGDLHTPILGSVVLSSATSWMVLHLLLGDEPLFHVAPYQLVNPGELLLYALLGIVGGFASVGFVKLLLNLRERFMRLPNKTLWLQPVAGGLTVGIMGYFVPEVLGVGYDQVNRVLGGNVVIYVVALLAVLKIVATAVCYASGNAGGIFGPSLFIGAMVGAAVGAVAHHLIPTMTAGAGAYALVGMGTAFAGIVRTPLTSVFMIFELTRDYSIIVPLMISNLLAFYISQKFQQEPIYESLARQDGLHLPKSASHSHEEPHPVTLAIREAPEPLDATMDVSAALERVRGIDLESWPVTDEKGLAGMVSQRALESAAASPDGKKVVGELLDHADGSMGPHLHTDHPLAVALERMGESGHNVLQVVSRANARILLGVVTLKDVLKAFGVTD